MRPNESSSNKQGFYVFGNKIIKFTEDKDYAGINMILTDIAEAITKPAHIN